MRACGAGRWPAGAPGGELGAVAPAGIEPGLELGHAPELADLAVGEARGEGAHEVRGDRRAGEHDEADRREVHPLEEPCSHARREVGGRQEEVGRAEALDRVRKGRGREGGEEGVGRAGGDRQLHRVKRIEMPERRRGQDDVPGPDVVLGDAEPRVGEHLVVAEGDALGARGGPGGVEQQERVGRGRLPPVAGEGRPAGRKPFPGHRPGRGIVAEDHRGLEEGELRPVLGPPPAGGGEVADAVRRDQHPRPRMPELRRELRAAKGHVEGRRHRAEGAHREEEPRRARARSEAGRPPRRRVGSRRGGTLG